MDYVKLVCPVCGVQYTNGDDRCAGCGSNHIAIEQQLNRVVDMLIKMGLGVISTEIHPSSNSDVIIHLRGAVPEYVLNELPDTWRLICYEAHGVKYYQLYGNGGNLHSTKEIIGQLEDWLENKDIDGVKAVLKLGGYENYKGGAN